MEKYIKIHMAFSVCVCVDLFMCTAHLCIVTSVYL